MREEASAGGSDVYVALRGLWKSFGTLDVLRGIDLEVAAGEVVVIIGPSGSGKSTLLRCVCLLEPIQRGEVEVEGVPIAVGAEKHARKPDKATVRRMRQEIGMVFQSFNLFPHLTALENITLAPRRVRKMTREEAEEQAKALLERVGLSDKANEHPARLSGGQQQRAAIARARAAVLFDEVTSALDPGSSVRCCASCASSRGHDDDGGHARDGVRTSVANRDLHGRADRGGGHP